VADTQHQRLEREETLQTQLIRANDEIGKLREEAFEAQLRGQQAVLLSG
jgi:hypothetical protein